MMVKRLSSQNIPEEGLLGWYEAADGAHLWYPTTQYLASRWAISISQNLRYVQLYGGSDNLSRIGDYDIPSHVQSLDEAKAWAIAVWRMR